MDNLERALTFGGILNTDEIALISSNFNAKVFKSGEQGQ